MTKSDGESALKEYFLRTVFAIFVSKNELSLARSIVLANQHNSNSIKSILKKGFLPAALIVGLSAAGCNDSSGPVAVNPISPPVNVSTLREVFVNDLVNERFYLETNPEVASLISSGQFASALDHFLRVGRQQGRQPSGYFNETFYLANNPDVVAAVNAGQFIDGLDHYLKQGQFEGRAPSELIDPQWLTRYLQEREPAIASGIQSGAIVAAKYFISQPIARQYELTAERAFLTLWNDRDFETINAVTTGADFRDNNAFTVLPGRHDGGRPGTFIGPLQG